MRAKSIKGKSTAAISTALQESLKDGFKPTLAICFVSIKQDRTAICKLLDEAGITIFGTSTNGEFTDEETENGSAAILLLDINKNYFQIYFEEYPQKNYREITNAVARKAKEKFSNPAFFIAGSHMETDAEGLLFGFEDIVGKDVNVYGCMAGDDFTFADQFVFTNGHESSRGMVCIALDEDKIMIRGVATCGWKAVGTVRTVTKSTGNHVYTVDDIPVLDITTKYGGLENVSPDNEGLLLEIAANFPLQLQREKETLSCGPDWLLTGMTIHFIAAGRCPRDPKFVFLCRLI